MRFGYIITGGSVDEQIALARAAEEVGWDAVFTWDGIHLGDSYDVHDPWVLMAGFAMATERIRLGAIIHPLARRRPWKVAREATTLDHLSHGRLILPVGLGAADDSGFGRVGEATDRRTRAERLDEALEILTGLWSGERFGYEGRHYRFEPMAFRPRPVQQPRIPIWVVALWPSERSMRRALRYDGVLAHYRPPDGAPDGPIPVDVLADMRGWLDGRSPERPLDLILEGTSPADPGDAGEHVAPYRDAGVTWWIESNWDANKTQMRRRIESGPPRVISSATA